MIVLIPCSVKPRDELLHSVWSIFPDCRIILSLDESIKAPDGVEAIVHKNTSDLPVGKAIYYYESILKGFVKALHDVGNQPILLLHENVVIDDTVRLLIEDVENDKDLVFSSARIRETRGAVTIRDNADRCVAFMLDNFIYCHTLNDYRKAALEAKTTLDYICKDLDLQNHKYKYNEDINIRELNSIWQN